MQWLVKLRGQLHRHPDGSPLHRRIDGNHVRANNGTGILAGGSDLIVRNSAGNNTTNYTPSSGVNFGPVQSASTATSPWANFAY